MTANAKPVEGVAGKRLAQSLLVGVVAGGLWFFLVQPMERAQAARQSRLEGMRRELDQFNEDAAKREDPAGKLASYDELIASSTAWAAASGDQTRLYDAIRKLADAHDVRLDRVDPSGPRLDRSARRGQPDSDASFRADVQSYRLQVRGSYAHVARFIGSLGSDLGATRVLSFKLSPAGGGERDQPGMVDAEIQTAHLKLSRILRDASASGGAQ
jgi:hypothetical protein